MVKFKVLLGTYTLFLILLCVPWKYIYSATYSFNKIIDSKTFIPETEFVFKRWNPPQINHGNIAFLGEDISGHFGIYLFTNGTLSKIVDEKTVIPNTRCTFTVISSFSLFQNNIAFRAEGSRSVWDSLNSRKAPEGIWLWKNGDIEKIVGPEMTASGSNNALGGIGFWQFALNGNSVVFPHGGLHQIGPKKTIFQSPVIYLAESGKIKKLINSNSLTTQGVGKITFLGLGNSSFHAGKLAFMARNENRNTIIYQYDNKGVKFIADGYTQIPEGHGTFTVIRPPAQSYGNIVFQADGDNQKGIYHYRDGKLLKVVDLGTPISENSDHFTHFHIHPSIYKETIAFLGFQKFIPYKPPELRTLEESKVQNWASLQKAGIYIFQKGKIYKVIENGDTLDGKIVNTVSISENCLSMSLLAFSVGFSDGSHAIYTAAINQSDN